MALKKLSAVLLLLFGVTALYACGEPEETCVCTCTCGSGQKTTIDDAETEENCSSGCDATCGADSYTTNYDCTTEG
jgi:hypothetical protein